MEGVPEQQQRLGHAHMVCSAHWYGVIPEQVWLHQVVLYQGEAWSSIKALSCINKISAELPQKMYFSFMLPAFLFYSSSCSVCHEPCAIVTPQLVLRLDEYVLLSRA